MSTYSTVKLADGNSVPGIGFGVGTAWFGRGVDRELVEALKTALATGYVHIDGAQAYSNEMSVGAALREAGVAREKLYITTKVGGEGLKDIRSSCKKSLEEMGIEYADLYLIHWPYDFNKNGVPSNEECWKAMEELKKEGLVKSIGVSNYRIVDLEKTLAVAQDKPVVNQIEFHPRVYEAAEPLFEFMKKHGIALEAYGPTVPITKFAGEPLDGTLKSVAAAVSERTGSNTTVEPSQILLLLAHQLGAIVITTSGKDWRMKQQLESAGLPKLTDAEIAEIKQAAQPQQRKFMQHMDSKDPAY